MFERFTDASRRVLVLAQEESRLLASTCIGTEHLLLGLIKEEHGVAAQALSSLGISLEAVRIAARDSIQPAGSGRFGSPPFTPRMKKVLELSLRETLALGTDEIGPEHLLLGVVHEGEGVGAQILVSLGADLAEVRRQVVQLLADIHGQTGIGERLTYRPDLPAELRSEGQEAPPTRPTATPARMVACSFCGSSPPESGRLIAGDDAFICERCVRHWFSRLGPTPAFRSRRLSSTGWTVDPPGPQPDDPDTARGEIEAAYLGAGLLSEDGQSLPTVERGENLGPTLAAAKQNRREIAARDIVISVDQVVFVDTEHAAVLFSISADGNPVLTEHRGDATVVDGVWKMARSTFCELMMMAGVSCPPAEE